MQEQSRYVVGIDVGTKTVRCVVGHVGGNDETPKIVGVGVAPTSGMRKGTVTNLAGPAAAIDRALESAERMSGHTISRAVLSINGTHLLSTKSDGMIAVGTSDSEVTPEDIARLEEVATTGKVPANREILELVPHAYRLDGQENIKDPVGMVGTRLEIQANIVSGLAPHVVNLQKTAEMAHVTATALTPAVLASARAVLTESQIENGVAVLDIGAATTGVAVFEEGDLQYLAVMPMGGQSVTNDLAIGLKTDPEVAEAVKLAHGRFGGKTAGNVETKHNKQLYTFDQATINEAVEARYEEILEEVEKHLKKAGRAGKLPSGVVLVGGASQLPGLVDFAKQQLGVSVKLGQSIGFSGVSEEARGPEFACAIGLMLIDAVDQTNARRSETAAGEAVKRAEGLLHKIVAKFK